MDGAAQAPRCLEGQELFRGACIDPILRYQPSSPIDVDNVVHYGEALTQITLPDPPRSGFRIVAPPRLLQPGEEATYCISWPFPEIDRTLVYAGRLYTTPGLHHSNVISKPINPMYGPNPYPDCHPGADDPTADLPAILPDVLFGSSTQVVGTETIVFPPGMAFRVDEAREISTSIHLLNASDTPQLAEVAYDFFTMPDSDLVEELAPFFFGVNGFSIPSHSTGKVGTSCTTFGGRMVSLMPHTHGFATDFTVDFEKHDGSEQRILQDGVFDLESDIRIYQPALDLYDVERLRFECTFNNTTDHEIVEGLGENEMCMLFGYMYPLEKQVAGYSPYQGDLCNSFQLGLFR
jgi:hypothetical protein